MLLSDNEAVKEYANNHETPSMFESNDAWRNGLISMIQGFGNNLIESADVIVDRWAGMPDSNGVVMTIKFAMDTTGANQYAVNYNHRDIGVVGSGNHFIKLDSNTIFESYID